MSEADRGAEAGAVLREWRRHRNLSQLDLAHRAGVSSRHVSFVETGRSRPTSSMILRLCDELAVPLREQNRCLLAAGFAPVHPELSLDAAPLAAVAAAVDGILEAQLPFPALVIDPGWDLIAANDAVYALLDGVAPRLLEPPVNVIRLTLDRDGLASRILNLAEWREHLLERLRRDLAIDHHPRVAALLSEFDERDRSSGRATPRPSGVESAPGLLVPLRLRMGDEVLSLISATTVFGTPREVTVAGLAIESFYPADSRTRELLSAT